MWHELLAGLLGQQIQLEYGREDMTKGYPSGLLEWGDMCSCMCPTLTTQSYSDAVPNVKQMPKLLYGKSLSLCEDLQQEEGRSTVNPLYM